MLLLCLMLPHADAQALVLLCSDNVLAPGKHVMKSLCTSLMILFFTDLHISYRYPCVSLHGDWGPVHCTPSVQLARELV